MKQKIELLDVVALAADLPEHGLQKGEIGAVVECYPADAYDVEFVSDDGQTYALVTLTASQLFALKKRSRVDAKKPVAYGRP